MTVSREVKRRRRRAIGARVYREYERTGRTAFEQWRDSVADLAPIHEKINRRTEIARERVPYGSPASAYRDRGLV